VKETAVGGHETDPTGEVGNDGRCNSPGWVEHVSGVSSAEVRPRRCERYSAPGLSRVVMGNHSQSGGSASDRSRPTANP
jgi:hypothetical protein